MQSKALDRSVSNAPPKLPLSKASFHFSTMLSLITLVKTALIFRKNLFKVFILLVIYTSFIDLRECRKNTNWMIVLNIWLVLFYVLAEYLLLLSLRENEYWRFTGQQGKGIYHLYSSLQCPPLTNMETFICSYASGMSRGVFSTQSNIQDGAFLRK